MSCRNLHLTKSCASGCLAALGAKNNAGPKLAISEQARALCAARSPILCPPAQRRGHGEGLCFHLLPGVPGGSSKVSSQRKRDGTGVVPHTSSHLKPSPACLAISDLPCFPMPPGSFVQRFCTCSTDKTLRLPPSRSFIHSLSLGGNVFATEVQRLVWRVSPDPTGPPRSE